MSIDEFYERNSETVQNYLLRLHDEALQLSPEVSRHDAIRRVVDAYRAQDPHWWTLWRAPEIVGGGLCMVPSHLKMLAFRLGFDMEFDPARVIDLDDDAIYDLPVMCRGAQYDDAGTIINIM